MVATFPNLIDGRSVGWADRNTDINPTNLADVVGEVARAPPADVNQAIA